MLLQLWAVERSYVHRYEQGSVEKIVMFCSLLYHDRMLGITQSSYDDRASMEKTASVSSFSQAFAIRGKRSRRENKRTRKYVIRTKLRPRQVFTDTHVSLSPESFSRIFLPLLLLLLRLKCIVWPPLCTKSDVCECWLRSTLCWLEPAAPRVLE